MQSKPRKGSLARTLSTPRWKATLDGPQWLGRLDDLLLLNLMPYALKGKGAAFDAQQHFGMEKAMELGRWATMKTAGSTSTRQRPSGQKSRLPLKVGES